jgi:predicted helicase
MLAGENIGLSTTRSIEIDRGWEHIFCTSQLTQLHTVSIKEVNYLFPLYLYPDRFAPTLFDTKEPNPNMSNNRQPNLAPKFITDLSEKLNVKFVPDGKGDLHDTIGPEDIFDYLYAIFHSPTYRSRYAEFLKRDFPHLPLTSDTTLFHDLSTLGAKLVELHFLEKIGKAKPTYPVNGNHLVEKFEYLPSPNQPAQGRVYINKAQYFEGVPPEVWEFYIGGYQVCQKWLKDRKGRVLSFDDIKHYQHIVAALAETLRLMDKIDVAIEEHGGWPIE